ncbi:MAG: PQQ-binding-like beta-propeller repeat protein [Synergistaceae bacterium]|nr:PQQ-binding-like beta-propeller repeat protein [Synergistaceae bacterium]
MKKFLLALLVVILVVSAASAFSGRSREISKVQSSITSGITISGSTILFGTETGDIVAINKNNGRMIWSYRVANTIKGTPVISGNNAIFADGEGVVTCLRISDGAFIWQSLPVTSDSVSSTMSDGAAVGGGMVFFTRDDGNLYAVDAKNGSTLWTYAGGIQRVRVAPGYGEGCVFLAGYDGKLDFIAPNNGKRTGGGGAGGAVNTPVVANGNVYFSAWDGSVQSVKIKGIVPQWHVKVSDVVTTSPAVSNNLVVVGTGRGSVAALNEKNGQILWESDLSKESGGEISSNIIISGGLVFAANSSGTLYVLDANTGAVRFNVNLGLYPHIAVDGGTVYASGGSTLYVLQ